MTIGGILGGRWLSCVRLFGSSVSDSVSLSDRTANWFGEKNGDVVAGWSLLVLIMPLLRFEHEGCSKSEGGDCAELMESDGGGGGRLHPFLFLCCPGGRKWNDTRNSTLVEENTALCTTRHFDSLVTAHVAKWKESTVLEARQTSTVAGRELRPQAFIPYATCDLARCC